MRREATEDRGQGTGPGSETLGLLLPQDCPLPPLSAQHPPDPGSGTIKGATYVSWEHQKERKRAEDISEVIMAENFPKLMTDTNHIYKKLRDNKQNK